MEDTMNTPNTNTQQPSAARLRAQQAARRLLTQLKRERVALKHELARERMRERWLTERW